MDKEQALAYYKARQKSILLKIEDLDSAVKNGISLENYLPEDESLATEQPTDSRFAQAFEAEERRTRGQNLGVSFRGTDNPMGDAVAAATSAAAGMSLNASALDSLTASSAGGIGKPDGGRTEKQLQVDKAFLNACYFGNTNAVLKLVKSGADVEFLDGRDGWAGIHYAARWGDIKMMMAILNAGADINLRTVDKETALHKATRWDQKEMAVLLLHRGALPHFKNGDGNKASQMTTNEELSYLCDNFEEWSTAEIARIKKEAEDQRFLAYKAERERLQEQKITALEAARRTDVSRSRVVGKK